MTSGNLAYRIRDNPSGERNDTVDCIRCLLVVAYLVSDKCRQTKLGKFIELLNKLHTQRI